MAADMGAYRTILTHFSQRYPKIPVGIPTEGRRPLGIQGLSGYFSLLSFWACKRRSQFPMLASSPDVFQLSASSPSQGANRHSNNEQVIEVNKN